MGKSILEGLSEPSNALKLQELARNLANIYPGIAGSRRIFKNRYPRERNSRFYHNPGDMYIANVYIRITPYEES